MSEEHLTPDEAKTLAENATQTRFTWAVVFLAFIAGLVGLLPMIKPYESNYLWWEFSIIISIIYLALTFGLSYSFYALWRTSYIIEHLRKDYETTSLKNFVEKHWGVFYSGFFMKRNGEFRKLGVAFFAGVGGALWILLFFLRFLI